MGLSCATTILSIGYRPLGSCSRAAGWSAATLCCGPSRKWRQPRLKSDMLRTADIDDLSVGCRKHDLKAIEPRRACLGAKVRPCHLHGDQAAAISPRDAVSRTVRD